MSDQFDAWIDVPARVDALAEKVAAPASAVRRSVSRVYTTNPIGVYFSPETEKYALCVSESVEPRDIQLTKEAIEAVGELEDVNPATREDMIKVAFTPWLRNAGEWLNFFPKDKSSVPNTLNNPGVVLSMLTSGMVGAGLGYGGGWLAERVLPESWRKKNLRRTLGMLGAAAGVTLPALWMYTNAKNDKSLLDNSLLNHPAQAQPQIDYAEVGDAVSSGLQEKSSSDNCGDVLSERYKIACEVCSGLVWECRKEAFKEAFDETMFGSDALSKEAFGAFAPTAPVDNEPPSPYDVNIDEMGRTLWEVGADPSTAGTTMSSLHAAHQMPGGSRPGFVTPSQMANLGVRMGAGHVSGALVGSALGLLTGMPEGPKNQLKRTGMYLGIVQSVVPKLFGQ